MKAKNKRNNLRRVFSILTVFLILALTLAMPCFAFSSVSEYEALLSLGYSSKLYAYAVDPYDLVAYAFFEQRTQNSDGSYNFNYCYYVNSNSVYSYIVNNGGYFDSVESYKSTLTIHGQIWSVNLLNSSILDIVNSFNSRYQTGLNNGSQAGKNQMMDELIQNANLNGTNIPNQLYSPENLINVLNEIRNSAEFDGAFNREDSDIRYLVDELIRLGVLAEPYDTFELTVDGNLENAKNIWFTEGLEESNEGISQRLQNAYNTGYTQGGKDADAMNNTLITIFSSPYYILNEVFNFEIFGVSVAGIITFLVSILLVGWIIRIIL